MFKLRQNTNLQKKKLATKNEIPLNKNISQSDLFENSENPKPESSFPSLTFKNSQENYLEQFQNIIPEIEQSKNENSEKEKEIVEFFQNNQNAEEEENFENEDYDLKQDLFKDDKKEHFSNQEENFKYNNFGLENSNKNYAEEYNDNFEKDYNVNFEDKNENDYQNLNKNENEEYIEEKNILYGNFVENEEDSFEIEKQNNSNNFQEDKNFEEETNKIDNNLFEYDKYISDLKSDFNQENYLMENFNIDNNPKNDEFFDKIEKVKIENQFYFSSETNYETNLANISKEFEEDIKIPQYLLEKKKNIFTKSNPFLIKKMEKIDSRIKGSDSLLNSQKIEFSDFSDPFSAEKTPTEIDEGIDERIYEEQKELNQNFFDKELTLIQIKNNKFIIDEETELQKAIFLHTKAEIKNLVERSTKNEFFNTSLSSNFFNVLLRSFFFYPEEFCLNNFSHLQLKQINEKKIDKSGRNLSLKEKNFLLLDFIVKEENILWTPKKEFILEIYKEEYILNDHIDLHFFLLNLKLKKLENLLENKDNEFYLSLIMKFEELNLDNSRNYFYKSILEFNNDFFVKLICLFLNKGNFFSFCNDEFYLEEILKIEKNITNFFLFEILFYSIYTSFDKKQNPEFLKVFFETYCIFLINYIEILFLTGDKNFIKNYIFFLKRMKLEYTQKFNENEVFIEKIIYYQNEAEKIGESFLPENSTQKEQKPISKNIFSFVTNIFGKKNQEEDVREQKITFCPKTKRYLVNGEILTEDNEKESDNSNKNFSNLDCDKDNVAFVPPPKIPLLPPKLSKTNSDNNNKTLQRKNQLNKNKFVAFNMK